MRSAGAYPLWIYRAKRGCQGQTNVLYAVDPRLAYHSFVACWRFLY
jgi:hypothetical protein